MELMACTEGLKALKFTCSVILYSDSRYVVHGMTTGWAKRWQAEGWRLHDDQAVRNAALWQQLVALDRKHLVRFCSVKSPASHPDSTRCAELATEAAKGKSLPADVGYETSLSDSSRSQ
jgi:ribonuclease HI